MVTTGQASCELAIPQLTEVYERQTLPPLLPGGRWWHRCCLTASMSAEEMVDDNTPCARTAGELAVLRLLVAGLRLPEIADTVGISPALARSRLDRVRDRSGCHNRVELVIRAVREGWLSGQPAGRREGERDANA
jgi:DNA-binding CsgD family transcriptional regulator